MTHNHRFVFLLAVFLTLGAAAQDRPAVPSESQKKWHEAEMGALFHYDLHVFDGKRYVQADNRRTPVENKRIVTIPAIRASRLRLTITAHTDTPTLRAFSAFYK